MHIHIICKDLMYGVVFFSCPGKSPNLSHLRFVELDEARLAVVQS